MKIEYNKETEILLFGHLDVGDVFVGVVDNPKLLLQQELEKKGEEE